MKTRIEFNNFFNKSRNEKLSFLEGIERIKDASAIEPLIELMEKEEETGIKEKILLILGELIHDYDYKSLEKMFTSCDPFTRNGAIEILKESKVHLYKHLKRLSEHPDKDIRKFSIDALKEDPSAESLEIISSRLTDKEINIRITAVEYLGNLKAIDCTDKIENMLLNEDNLLFICTALESLANIGTAQKRKQIIDKFKNTDNPIILPSFIKYIGAIGGKDELTILLKLAIKDKNVVKREFIDALESIMYRIKPEKLPKDMIALLRKTIETTDINGDKYEILKILSSEEENNEKLNIARRKLKSDSILEVLSAIEIIGEEGNKEDIDLLDELADSTENDDILEAIGDAATKLIRKNSG